MLHIDEDSFATALSLNLRKRRSFLKNMCCCSRDVHVTIIQGERSPYLMMSFGECGGGDVQEGGKCVPGVLEGAPSS